MIAVIPAREPDEKLIETVKTLFGAGYSVIVADCSSQADGRLFDALAPFAKVLRTDAAGGRGAALKAAFRYIASDASLDRIDGVMTVDAAVCYSAEDYERAAEAWRNAPEAVVAGSREPRGRGALLSRIGNGVTRLVFALTTGTRLKDVQPGLVVFSAGLLDWAQDIEGDGSEYGISLLISAAKEHMHVKEVAVRANASRRSGSARGLWLVFRTLFSFFGSSIVCFATDYALVLSLNALFAHFTSAADPKLPAVVIARVISSALNYALNRRVVFRSGSRLSVPLYYAAAGLILGLNYLLLKLMEVGGIPLWIAEIAAQAVLYPLSFVLQRRFVFQERAK